MHGCFPLQEASGRWWHASAVACGARDARQTRGTRHAVCCMCVHAPRATMLLLLLALCRHVSYNWHGCCCCCCCSGGGSRVVYDAPVSQSTHVHGCRMRAWKLMMMLDSWRGCSCPVFY